MTSWDTHTGRCTFIPPWLAERVDGPERAALDEALRAERARRGLEARSARTSTSDATAEGLAAAAAWTVHDAGSTTSLPGTPARSTGEPETGDVAVDEAAVGIEATLAMFAEVLERDSHDDAGAPVSLTVHYGSDYNNAFWDGTQLVFGDGDGRIFERFTKPVDVLAHEFSHAVVEHTAGLVYRDQSGALNESVADVFASCLKQRLLGQDAADGDWLIGEGIFTPSIRARALRDMAAPGTAYDDPELGADPQVGHMDDYVETTADNGGVHLNSGIPNKAFQLAAVAVGGRAIEGAGRIWYDALVGGDVTADADFATFAAATVAVAGEHADVVRQAWAQVGVGRATGSAAPAPQQVPTGRLRVERSGGFIGRTETAEVDLDDPALPDVRALVEQAGLAALDGSSDPTPRPDMFLYTFTVGDRAPVRVPEHLLTAGQAELAHRLLRPDG
ncbi:Thermolysin metallopeptidase, catalytic domain [Nocardioides alpinus]|uniref:Neutral metalloproteinase n=1 Tax=Nocardioides alpinus TaxID=748909 RepID=A0A1I0W2D7_9ACTN|nr:protealysin inhibitor emfourin [Nocardioides alpinus]PKH37634.1 M4 family peptidase [Nocardioides alpinus]SFA82704.1 Thermolysin metallopeptidase, catalytic domain [Nocardioides alpinus]